jgi:hypothetical protein
VEKLRRGTERAQLAEIRTHCSNVAAGAFQRRHCKPVARHLGPEDLGNGCGAFACDGRLRPTGLARNKWTDVDITKGSVHIEVDLTMGLAVFN